jgi:hypothetical protein
MGRPAGSQNKDKPFRDALRLEIAEAEGSPRALRMIASKLIDMAAAGDMQAIREIGDRMDGKPAQALELSGETTHNYVARMPAPVKGMDEWQTRYSPNQNPSMTKQ